MSLFGIYPDHPYCELEDRQTQPPPPSRPVHQGPVPALGTASASPISPASNNGDTHSPPGSLHGQGDIEHSAVPLEWPNSALDRQNAVSDHSAFVPFISPQSALETSLDISGFLDMWLTGQATGADLDQAFIASDSNYVHFGHF